MRGRYSIIGLEPDVIWRTIGGEAEINRDARGQSGWVRALPAAAASGAARADRRKPDRTARGLAADGGRRVRLSRLRHGSADGGSASAQSRPDRHSRCRVDPPDAHRRVRRGEGFDHRRYPGPSGARRRRQCGARARRSNASPAWSMRSTVRSTSRSAGAFDAGPIDVPAKSNTTPDEFKAMVRKAKDYIVAGDIFQVVLSQRFEAPFTLPPFSLYRALRRVNPSPLSVFPRFRRLRDRRIEPRGAGAVARRHGDDPAARRHPAARRDAARGQGAGG